MTPPVFRKFDAGAMHSEFRDEGDCQVRALCTARGLPYPEAWTLLYAIQGERRTCSFAIVRELDAPDCSPALGLFRRLSFPAVKGKRRMTAGEFCRKHPRGRFILRLAHHVVCAKDGQLYDTWDCSQSCVYVAWEIRPIEAAGAES